MEINNSCNSWFWDKWKNWGDLIAFSYKQFIDIDKILKNSKLFNNIIKKINIFLVKSNFQIELIHLLNLLLDSSENDLINISKFLYLNKIEIDFFISEDFQNMLKINFDI